MRSVRIEKDKLLEVLKKNREEHIAIFNEAIIGYRRTVVTALEELLALAREGKAYKTSIDIDEPCSYEDKYNSIIKMLEMSSEDIIELDQREFYHYVEDKWDWQRNFLMSGALYGDMARKKIASF